MYPAFITASDGISLEILNSFISEAYKPYRAMEPLPVTLSIINHYEPASSPNFSLESKNSDGPTTKPLATLPSIPEAFASASPQACSALARSRFPAQPDLAWDGFVVLDDFTEASRTVVVGAHDGDRGLVLARSDFRGALSIHVSATQSLGYDVLADIASRTAQGVERCTLDLMPDEILYNPLGCRTIARKGGNRMGHSRRSSGPGWTSKAPTG
ncbi:hypothetical protein PspLS_02457 [Pyricularia sp. CBS 133598]|nr:hypothetical protein PspLS_02457 [Pyricularia sp. CBS 133598]